MILVVTDLHWVDQGSGQYPGLLAAWLQRQLRRRDEPARHPVAAD